MSAEATIVTASSGCRTKRAITGLSRAASSVHCWQIIAKSRRKQYRGKWIPANQTQNLPHIHQQRKQKIPSIKYRDIYIGFTAPAFCKWENIFPKNQSETPCSKEGRQLYFKRTKKKRMNARLDAMYSESTSRVACYTKWGNLNHFEFTMNRAYALNRDRLKCRVCGDGSYPVCYAHIVSIPVSR